MAIHRTLLAAAVVAASILSPDDVGAQRPDTTAWLADFADLQLEMARHYSTLQWQIADRGLDLRRLAADARAAIRAAPDDAAARSALRRFLAAFADGHLSVSWPDTSASRSSRAAAPVSSLCTRLGIDGVPAPRGLAVDAVGAYTALASPDDAVFPAGVLTVGGRRVGVVRIGLFEASPFPALCESVRTTLAVPPEAPCDGACEAAFDRGLSDSLTAALVRQVRRLRARRVDVVAVDLTGNPGGTDWNEPAARVLTSRRIYGSRYGFIRHDHWATTLARRLRTLESDTAGLEPAQRRAVREAADRVRGALAAARTPCDLMPLWDNQSVSCALVVDRPLFVTGLVAYAAPGSLPRRPSSTVLFTPSQYTYREGEYDGPLWIIVDERSASSAERFTAMLQDHDAAVVIGVPTLGAGCGYTNGGIPVRLARTGARVRMPDCFQFRKDMTSVGDGITPDVLVPWRSTDTPRKRVDRLLATLPRAPLWRRHPAGDTAPR